MPELPEVETTVEGLKPHISQQQIVRVSFHREAVRYPLEPSWIDAIAGHVIVSVSRRAKLIIIELDRGYLLFHLGMTGSLRICHADEQLRKHDHVEFHLGTNKILRFHDPRRFGYLHYFPTAAETKEHYKHYGPEPLLDDFDAQYLWELSRSKKVPIKNFIMNQKIVVGVGNIYACEALFMAGIHPTIASGKISKKRYEALVAAIKAVLTKAIAEGGTTLKDFENADAKPGYFQQSLAVYGRTEKPCTVCGTLIKEMKIGGRNSFYCPTCQK